jgi:hypothetical protein
VSHSRSGHRDTVGSGERRCRGRSIADAVTLQRRLR